MFLIMLISLTVLVKRWWKYTAHFSTDEFAKNGALERCRHERTTAYHQDTCILPAINECLTLLLLFMHDTLVSGVSHDESR